MQNKYDELLTNIANDGFEFRFSNYFSSGLELFKKNSSGFMGFGAILAAIALASSMIPYAGSVVSSLIQPALLAGMYLVANDVIRDQTPGFNRFFKGFDFFVPLLLAQLVSALIIFAGLICLIIPGIYLAVSYTFTSFFIVFMKYDFWTAMEWSRKIVAKNFWPIFGFALVIGGINIAGALFCGIGLIFTFPFTACVMFCAFEDIISTASRKVNV